jgi:hypothetical protein
VWCGAGRQAREVVVDQQNNWNRPWMVWGETRKNGTTVVSPLEEPGLVGFVERRRKAAGKPQEVQVQRARIDKGFLAPAVRA